MALDKEQMPTNARTPTSTVRCDYAKVRETRSRYTVSIARADIPAIVINVSGFDILEVREGVTVKTLTLDDDEEAVKLGQIKELMEYLVDGLELVGVKTLRGVCKAGKNRSRFVSKMAAILHNGTFDGHDPEHNEDFTKLLSVAEEARKKSGASPRTISDTVIDCVREWSKDRA